SAHRSSRIMHCTSFLSCSRAQPYLHSFPTRRSSDLGIPAESFGRVFEKFGQLDSRRVGTGLGLAFCKLAVEAHGGRIAVESTIGDRKSTRLNSSHLGISYAVFCLKKKSLRTHGNPLQ